MPPALSDEENEVSSGEEEIPFQGKADEDVKNEEDDEQEEEEGEEDEYVVEKIMGHKIQKGQIQYDVKWQGYDDPKDRTWEPEENLETASEALHDYFEEIGGRPTVTGKKRKGRKSGAETETSTPVNTKRVKKEKSWSPPPGSWETEVDVIDTVTESINEKTGEKERFVFVVWNNQNKTQHPLRHIYQKCPQKMLQYYEEHLSFTENYDEE